MPCRRRLQRRLAVLCCVRASVNVHALAMQSPRASAPRATLTTCTHCAARAAAVLGQVLAGALKDNKRSTIVGEPTFGKGLIQTVVELSDGSGLAVTVARYQTPNGVDINRVGITPDVRLDSAALPLDGSDLCRLLASTSAPKLFSP
jgi:hypothetical protein